MSIETTVPWQDPRASEPDPDGWTPIETVALADAGSDLDRSQEDEVLTEAEAMIAATGIAEQVVDEFIADVVAASPHGEGVDLPSEWQDVPTELDVDAFIAEPAFDPARFGFDLDDTALNLPGDDGWMMLGSGALETTEFSVEANDNRADAGYTVTEPDGSWLPVGGTSDLS